MPRSAEELLEFGRLRGIVCGFSTCAPGRKAIGGCAEVFAGFCAKLQGEFALIRESMEWLRGSNELGFGALADPDPWLTRLEPGVSEIAASTTVLAPGELLDAASLLNTAAWLKTHFHQGRENRFRGLSVARRNHSPIFARSLPLFAKRFCPTAQSVMTHLLNYGAFAERLRARAIRFRNRCEKFSARVEQKLAKITSRCEAIVM